MTPLGAGMLAQLRHVLRRRLDFYDGATDAGRLLLHRALQARLQDCRDAGVGTAALRELATARALWRAKEKR